MRLAVKAMEIHEITLQEYIVMEEKVDVPKMEQEITNARKYKGELH